MLCLTKIIQRIVIEEDHVPTRFLMEAAFAKNTHVMLSYMSKGISFSDGPCAPQGFQPMTVHTTLESMRDALTNGHVDQSTAETIAALIERWRNAPTSVDPLAEMQRVLEQARTIPRGDERVKVMNAIVRTLGRPDTLATFLDMLRDAATRSGTTEQEYCRSTLQNVRMHSIYGWCGNTLTVESLYFPTDGTYEHIPGLGERLGNSPSAWNLTVHIWQPNVTAKGFPLDIELESGALVEPPHSHPFDFVSTVVKGTMHQSIYAQSSIDAVSPPEGKHRYGHVPLEHVDGVWPPHEFRETCALKTLEHRVTLTQGDSYYMPCHWIHDVEINKTIASTKPTITLFLSSEYMVMPHVYMTKAMADFHSKNPDIKKNGVPIPESAWHRKLAAISGYLRDEPGTLNLNDIVDYRGEYAFFNTDQNGSKN